MELSAVTLVTIDMEASVAFYDALGFRVLYGGADAAFTSYELAGSYLNLQLVEEGKPPGIWGRVIFWVEDVDSMHARTIAAGFTPATSPADAPWGERYFHIHDPDGHELSFARPLSPP